MQFGWVQKILAWLVYIVYKPWCHSTRISFINFKAVETLIQEKKSFVLALWHNEMFPLIVLKSDFNLPMITLASQSKDGEFITKILHHLNFKVARGSSSRGGVKAMLQMAKAMREQSMVCAITVDGPKGPRHKVKEGAIFVAHQAHAPIIPVRAYVDKSIIFKSWDRFILPLPFTKIKVVFGEPYIVSQEKLSQEQMQTACTNVENILSTLR